MMTQPYAYALAPHSFLNSDFPPTQRSHTDALQSFSIKKLENIHKKSNNEQEALARPMLYDTTSIMSVSCDNTKSTTHNHLLDYRGQHPNTAACLPRQRRETPPGTTWRSRADGWSTRRRGPPRPPSGGPCQRRPRAKWISSLSPGQVHYVKDMPLVTCF